MMSWSGSSGFGPVVSHGLSRSTVVIVPRSFPSASMLLTVETAPEAASCGSVQVRPPSYDLATAMFSTATCDEIVPSTKSRTPIEIIEM